MLAEISSDFLSFALSIGIDYFHFNWCDSPELIGFDKDSKYCVLTLCQPRVGMLCWYGFEMTCTPDFDLQIFFGHFFYVLLS